MLEIKSYGITLVVALGAILGTGIVFADDKRTIGEISIDVAPDTLNLN